MAVTLKQVAKRAGVSASAVSRTFTQGASVSEKTRKKVGLNKKSACYISSLFLLITPPPKTTHHPVAMTQAKAYMNSSEVEETGEEEEDSPGAPASNIVPGAGTFTDSPTQLQLLPGGLINSTQFQTNNRRISQQPISSHIERLHTTCLRLYHVLS